MFAAVVQELWRGVRARRAMAREPVPVALVSLVRRNRRRYGGYLVHVGRDRAVRRRGRVLELPARPRRRGCRPGRPRRSAATAFTYVKPTAQLHAAPNGRLERISFGALLRVRRGGGTPRLLTTSKDYFPSQDPTLGPVVALLRRRVDDRGRPARRALRNDIWTAVAPDTSRLAPQIAQGDQRVRQERPTR